MDQLPSVPRATTVPAPSVERQADAHESRVPLTLLGLLCIAVGMYFLLNPAAPLDIDRSSLGMFAGVIPESVVNLQKLILGQTLTIAGAIFLAAAWRPR